LEDKLHRVRWYGQVLRINEDGKPKEDFGYATKRKISKRKPEITMVTAS
jgi:hypothetical protein